MAWRCALTLALAHTAVADIALTYSVLPQAFADTYGAACLDGSPPSFYASVNNASLDKWVIFIEGGGWCFSPDGPAATIANCAGRAGGGGGSSQHNGPSMNVGGMLSTNVTKNPRFAAYSLVFVHYCDGSSHSSNASAPIPVPAALAEELNGVTQIYLRGRPNLAAVLGYLHAAMGMPAAPSEVLISGGSAGATSTYLGIDWVASLFPPSTKVAAVPDAGFFLDGINVGTGTPAYRDSFIAADGVWNTSQSGGMNAACLSAYAPSNETWRCFFPQYSLPFLKTPLFVSNSLLDMWQVLNDLALPCVPSTNGASVSGLKSCTPAQLSVMGGYRDAVLSALLGALATNPGTGAWAVTCFVHEINVEYCSSQSLPNCCGFGSQLYPGPACATGGTGNYSVPWTGGQRWNLNDAFTRWYDATVGDSAAYYAVRAAREAYVASAVVAVQGGAPPPTWASLVAAGGATGAFAALDAALPQPVQVVDTVDYPGNPSCPFPGVA